MITNFKIFEKKEMNKEEKEMFNLANRLQYNFRKYFKSYLSDYFGVYASLWGSAKIYISFSGAIPNDLEYLEKHDNYTDEKKRLKIGHYFNKKESEKLLNSVKTEFKDLIEEKNKLNDIQKNLEYQLQEIFYPNTIELALEPFAHYEFTICFDYSILDISKYEELLKIIDKSILIYDPKFNQLINLTKVEAIKLINNIEKLKINIETRKYNL